MTDWAEAACLTVDPELFAPPGHDRLEELNRVAEAVQVCRRCPLTAACLLAGLHGRESGVWGGVILADGQATRHNQHRVLMPCGTYAAYRRHLRRREPPCADCRAEYARTVQEQRERRAHLAEPCGTPAAARRHYRRREPLCAKCRRATTRGVA